MMKRQIIGIVGGGQLGRMLIQAGMNYPVSFHVYSDAEDFPSKPFCDAYTVGPLNDFNRIVQFGLQCDIITIEIENINTDALKQLQQYGKKVYPNPEAVKIIQDRLTQKEFLLSLDNVPTLEYFLMENSKIKYPYVNKLRKGGYDGYGTKIVNSKDDVLFTEPSIIEPYYEFKREIAVQVARNALGQTVVFPIVETVFKKNNMLDYLICACENEYLIQKVNKIATTIAEKLNFVGILAIELFQKDYEIMVNELAPRPHNSGHHTQDMFNVSQFDVLMRCLLDLPLPNIKRISNFGATVNMLGSGTGNTVYNNLDKLLLIPSVHVHIYDKQSVKPSRKMGHVNILANTKETLMDKVDNVKNILENAVTGNDDNAVTGNDDNQSKDIVGVIMGSTSDLEIMKGATDILKQFDVPYEIEIVSAHRTPENMIQYAKTAEEKGLKVIIAGAGGAAHLPGMIASCTNLPVIGVPIKSRNSIDGWDSLLSIVQMPEGVPVATVGLDNSKNAGLLAVRILGLNWETEQYRRELKNKVQEMNNSLKI